MESSSSKVNSKGIKKVHWGNNKTITSYNSLRRLLETAIDKADIYLIIQILNEMNREKAKTLLTETKGGIHAYWLGRFFYHLDSKVKQDPHSYNCELFKNIVKYFMELDAISTRIAFHELGIILHNEGTDFFPLLRIDFDEVEIIFKNMEDYNTQSLTVTGNDQIEENSVSLEEKATDKNDSTETSSANGSISTKEASYSTSHNNASNEADNTAKNNEQPENLSLQYNSNYNYFIIKKPNELILLESQKLYEHPDIKTEKQAYEEIIKEIEKQFEENIVTTSVPKKQENNTDKNTLEFALHETFYPALPFKTQEIVKYPFTIIADPLIVDDIEVISGHHNILEFNFAGVAEILY